MYLSIRLGVLAVLFLGNAFCSKSFAAAIVNGSFESNNFQGWSTTTGALVVDDVIGAIPFEGDFQALLLTSLGESPSTLSSLLQVPLVSINQLATAQVFQGTGITQSFTFLGETIRFSAGVADVGDDAFSSALLLDNIVFDSNTRSISFAWNMLTEDTAPSDAFNDLAFFSFDGTLTRLAQLTDPIFVDTSVAGFAKETGWRQFGATVPPPGIPTATIPEPSGLLVLVVGSVLAFGLGNRLRGKAHCGL